MKRVCSVVIALCLIIGSLPTVSAVSGEKPVYSSEFTEGKVKKVAGVSPYVIVLKEDGTVWANGHLGSGIEGVEFDSPGGDLCTFKKIFEGAKDIETDSGGLAIIKEDGSLWITNTSVWAEGQPRTKQTHKFHKILDDVKQVSTPLALKNDGTVWGWGEILTAMQFPISMEDVPVRYTEPGGFGPRIVVPVKMMEGVKKVQCTSYASLFLMEDGRLLSVGFTRFGETGWAGAEDYWKSESAQQTVSNDDWIWTPTEVLNDVKDIKTRDSRAFAIKNDDTLWAWGNLALDFNSVQFAPKKISENVKDCTAYETTIMVIKTNGEMWAIGKDALGKAGVGTQQVLTKNGTIEIKGLLDGVENISNNYAVKSDGSLWGWGRVGYDEFDTTIGRVDGTYYTLEPIQLAGPASVAENTLLVVDAMPSCVSVLVNGKLIAFDAYTVQDNNYFKLRDIATALSGTEMQFDVTWNSVRKTIDIQSGQNYTGMGGELATGSADIQMAIRNMDRVYLDGVEIAPLIYTIAGSNYFKLRDIGALFDFSVTWDGASQTISIVTTNRYEEA